MATPIEIIHISKQDGRTSKPAWDMFINFWRSLGDGVYEIPISKVTRTYNTRYKFYFAYLLPEIIKQLNLVVIDNNQVQRSMQTSELHDYLKLQFNGVVMKSLNGMGWVTLPGSTTLLSDGDFINEYEEKIAAHFISEHHLDLWDRETWIRDRKDYHNGLIEKS